MKTNLFVVESPLQLLSAIEAAHRTEPKSKNVLVIRYGDSSRTRNNEQMRLLVNNYAWSHVIDFSDPDTHSMLIHVWRRIKLEQIKFKFKGHISKFYFGEFRAEWMHYLRSSVSPDESYLLDDGAVTIQVQQVYIARGLRFPDMQPRSKLEKIALKLIYLGVLNKRVLSKQLHLFTAFNLNGLAGQKLDYHHYDNLKKQFAAQLRTQTNEVWFFGSKYSEASVLSLDDELLCLQQVNEYFEASNYDLKYVPHRDETPEKLDYVEHQMGIPLIQFDVPAEIYLLQSPTLPSLVAGYYTTVLLNTSVLISEVKTLAFQIPNEMIAPKFREATSNVYDFIRASKINVVDLTSLSRTQNNL